MTILYIISILGYVWLICDLVFITPWATRMKAEMYRLKSAYQIPDEDMPDMRLIRFKKKGGKRCKK